MHLDNRKWGHSKPTTFCGTYHEWKWKSYILMIAIRVLDFTGDGIVSWMKSSWMPIKGQVHVILSTISSACSAGPPYKTCLLIRLASMGSSSVQLTILNSVRLKKVARPLIQLLHNQGRTHATFTREDNL